MQRPSKTQINQLPRYTGLSMKSICIVNNADTAKMALSELEQQCCLGFDTESKPTFRKGQHRAAPALIQLASMERAFIFPTRFECALDVARKLLSNENIKKVGFGLKPDRKELRTKLGVELINSQDLAVELRKLTGDKNDIGARAAVAMLLNQRLSKGAQLSNWGAYPLSEQQIKYAANDAHAAICVANILSTDIL